MHRRCRQLPALGLRRPSHWLAAAACLVGLAAPAPLLAGERATFQLPVEAVIVTQLSFFKVDDLSFGWIAPGTTPGTVTIAPSGARTATGGVRLVAGLSHQPAAFAGKGSFNQALTLSINATSRTLTRVGGNQTMTMDSFAIGSSPVTTLTTSPLAFSIGSASGMFQFPVGARLRVKANQMPGIYQGNFTLTLNYQ